MRLTLHTMAAAAGFLLFSTAAIAQPDWYSQREDRYSDEHTWHARLFTEIREDLNHVQTDAFRDGDQYRIEATKQDLNALQSSMAAHRYDEGKIDEVVGSLNKVVADNRLSSRDRDVLNDDLKRLRDYRAHHDEWDK